MIVWIVCLNDYVLASKFLTAYGMYTHVYLHVFVGVRWKLCETLIFILLNVMLCSVSKRRWGALLEQPSVLCGMGRRRRNSS